MGVTQGDRVHIGLLSRLPDGGKLTTSPSMPLVQIPAGSE